MSHLEKYTIVHDFVIGRLSITSNGHQLTSVSYVDNNTPLCATSNRFTKTIIGQLDNYFSSSDWAFTIPMKVYGTPFQQRLWKHLQTIPTGKTQTYQEVAQQLETSPRAVGGACRANPVPIIVPCHRVLAKSGLGGYDGDWGSGKVNIKQWLLNHEQALV